MEHDERVPRPVEKSTGKRQSTAQDRLDTLRLRAGYAILALIVILAVYDTVRPGIDLGVFATLMGGLLALLGLGAVIKFTGGR